MIVVSKEGIGDLRHAGSIDVLGGTAVSIKVIILDQAEQLDREGLENGERRREVIGGVAISWVQI